MTQTKSTISVLERELEETTASVVGDTVAGELVELIHRQRAPDQVTTAVVEQISPEGVAKVILAGETQSCDASSIVQFPSAAAASAALLGRTVLVLLNRHTQPVIMGAVAQRLWDKGDDEDSSEAHAKLSNVDPISVQLDKRRLDLEATDEIRLTCGKSSLVLRRDGTVVIRGVNIVSRAAQSNKVKGGTVSLN